MLLGDRPELRVEAAVLGLARRDHAIEIGAHHLGQPERAAEPPPPAARQAERAQERREERDVAEADGDLSRRGLARAGDRKRQRLGVGAQTIRAADILVARLQPLRRALVVAAEDEAAIGIARRPVAALKVREADGDGEVGAERQPLALRSLRHEHAAADVLARRLQKRIGRMQHRHIDEARAGAVEERAKAGGERGHKEAAIPSPIVIPEGAQRLSGTHEHLRPETPRDGDVIASPAMSAFMGPGLGPRPNRDDKSSDMAATWPAASPAASSLPRRSRRQPPRTARGALPSRPRDPRRSPPPAPCRRRGP